MKTVAVIQPYFFPYAGYFRLFAAADVVVMFDCVQFPRRGWVHRNRFRLANGEFDWLTLPLEKAPQDVRIADLHFRADARSKLVDQLRRFPILDEARHAQHFWIQQALSLNDSRAAAYLCATIGETANVLGIKRPIIRSSSLDISPDLRGQERVLEIVTRLEGTRYVNPSGGRALYDHSTFEESGVELLFLSPYEGGMESILSRLISEPLAGIREEIQAQTILAA